jgi:RNA polymerase sigma-70 factor, ECF subfamily
MVRGVQDVAALDRSPESLVLAGRSLMSTRTAEQRLTLLMQQYFDFVWRSLRRLGLDVADADDATQEVFVLASRKLDTIAPGSERSFLFGTALKMASTRRRTLKRRPERADVDVNVEEQDEQSAPGPERLTQLTQARELLQALLAEMALELRAPFVLFELEELTVPQIAELLAIPPGTVSSRLRAARAEFQAGVRRLQARDAFHGRAR